MTDAPGQKGIIEGFSDDFETIKNEFSQSSPDLRLQDFFTFWRSSHLDCLFANRFDPRELLESIVAINEELVALITDQFKDSITRIIALYMLLCISAKQPSRFRRKIRLTCYDAIRIQDLCNESKLARAHNDVEFCWYKLRKMEAIDFVEERQVYGPSMLKNRKRRTGNDSLSKNQNELAHRDTSEFLNSRLEPAFDELDVITDRYSQLRDTLELDTVQGATDGLESGTSVRDLLYHAKSLLRDFKASQTR